MYIHNIIICNYNNYVHFVILHRTLIWSILALLPLLCGTWIIGLLVLAASEVDADNESVILAWIFTVINSLQVCMQVHMYGRIHF